MKKTNLLLTFFIMFALIGISPSTANAASFTSYVSGITMQNQAGTTASVSIMFYNTAGDVVDTVSDSIDPYGVKDYSTVPAPSGFTGSAIISSNTEIGAVSTLRGDNKGRGAYTAAKLGDTSVVTPILMKNWGSSNWNTWFSVQNVGDADTDIYVDYAACAGTNNKSALGVKAGASATFDQKTETCFPAAKTLTSAVVTSAQPVAIVVSQESTVVNSSLVSSGFPSGDTNPVVPLMNSNNPTSTGWRTAITVFNDGASSTSVTMTYVKTDGTTCLETQTIDSKTSKGFAGNNLIVAPADGHTMTCALGVKLVGSAYVSGNSPAQPLVATVNQDRGSLSSAYGALAPSAATPKVVFPQIQDRNGATSQWASSIMIFNVGAPTYVKCTFANDDYAPVSGLLNTNKAWENLQRDNIAASYVGSGQCTAYTSSSYTTVDTAADIVAVVNIRGLNTALFDLMMSYEGMNVTP